MMRLYIHLTSYWVLECFFFYSVTQTHLWSPYWNQSRLNHPPHPCCTPPTPFTDMVGATTFHSLCPQNMFSMSPPFPAHCTGFPPVSQVPFFVLRGSLWKVNVLCTLFACTFTSLNNYTPFCGPCSCRGILNLIFLGSDNLSGHLNSCPVARSPGHSTIPTLTLPGSGSPPRSLLFLNGMLFFYCFGALYMNKNSSH